VISFCVVIFVPTLREQFVHSAASSTVAMGCVLLRPDMLEWRYASFSIKDR